MFIAIEGADANGKATQAARLTERLGATLFSFPRYETKLGAAILRHLKGTIAVRAEHTIDSSDPERDCMTVYELAKEDPMVFQCMMTIDKYDAQSKINEILKAGGDVVSDRWGQSAEIYGTADGLDRAWLSSIQGCLLKPDLSIYLEVSQEESLRRRPKLRDRYEKDPEKQARIRALYRDMWSSRLADGDISYVIVNGEGTEEEVAARIWEAFAKAKVSEAFPSAYRVDR